MNALLNVFIDLCRLKAAPQDLPYSQFLMALTIAAYLLLGLGISSMEQSLGLALLSAGVDTGLMIGLAYLGLWIKSAKERLVQTTTALCGTGAIFEFISWPLVGLLQQASDDSPNSLGLLLILFFVWIIAVIGNILRHALEMPLWLGIGISLLYVYTSLRVMVALQIASGGIS